MRKDPRVYLAHILECIEKIERYTQGGQDVFRREELVQDAVMRNLEIIGEAAKRIDEPYRAAHPDIPWRGMAGLRDVSIHRYEELDLDQVWAVIDQHLVPLKTAIMATLPPLDLLERELAGEE